MRAVKRRLEWNGNFDHITQECPKSRTRFRPEVVPEVLAWLLTMSDRYGKMLDHLAKVNMRDQTVKSLEAMRDAETRCNCIAELMSLAPDMWNTHTWLEACIEVDKGLRAGKVVLGHKPIDGQTHELGGEG